VTEYTAFQLLTNYATDASIQGYVDSHDFYIFPVVNPDGKAAGITIQGFSNNHRVHLYSDDRPSLAQE
jgi:murein tripeptide amidase MpaA